jgi:hypothetical protein
MPWWQEPTCHGKRHCLFSKVHCFLKLYCVASTNFYVLQFSISVPISWIPLETVWFESGTFFIMLLNCGHMLERKFGGVTKEKWSDESWHEMVLSDTLMSWLLVLTMGPSSINLHQDCEPKGRHRRRRSEVSEMFAFIKGGFSKTTCFDYCCSPSSGCL